MERTYGYRMLPLAITAGGGALIAVALFGDRWPWKDRSTIGAVGASSGPAPIVLRTYACPQCGGEIGWGNNACPGCAWCRVPPSALPAAAAAPAALTPTAAAPAVALPDAKAPRAALVSPRDQNAARKEFIEGHWLGLEVIPLTPELAREYQIPPRETGILVDEITLEAAESGILAGDMVQSIEGRPTPDLRAFFLATQRVQNQARAAVAVNRRGQPMTFSMKARNTQALGFAQMEAAQPIPPGAISPHRARSKACTECHIIMQTGGQLPTDAGDILPNPPPIARDATMPHRYRGQCATCHVVK